jgi:hypothetical protein
MPSGCDKSFKGISPYHWRWMVQHVHQFVGGHSAKFHPIDKALKVFY